MQLHNHIMNGAATEHNGQLNSYGTLLGMKAVVSIGGCAYIHKWKWWMFWPRSDEAHPS